MSAVESFPFDDLAMTIGGRFLLWRFMPRIQMKSGIFEAYRNQKDVS
jgi:hypothetical protein